MKFNVDVTEDYVPHSMPMICWQHRQEKGDLSFLPFYLLKEVKAVLDFTVWRAVFEFHNPIYMT